MTVRRDLHCRPASCRFPVGWEAAADLVHRVISCDHLTTVEFRRDALGPLTAVRAVPTRPCRLEPDPAPLAATVLDLADPETGVAVVYEPAAVLGMVLDRRPSRAILWLLVRHDSTFLPEDACAAALLVPGLRRLAAVDVDGTSVGLTARQREILQLLGDGLTAAAIASRTRISVRTVHKHLQNIYCQLGCGDRLAAVDRGRELGLIGRRPYAELRIPAAGSGS